MESNFRNILIIGLGLMGGSFLKKLQTSDAHLFAMDISDDVARQATQDNDALTMITFADTAVLKTIDLVIVTLYPSEVLVAFDQLDKVLSAHALVIDISGVKRYICEEIQHRSYHFSYILTHPMAGRERGGYAFSLPTIFEGANFIIIRDVIQASKEKINMLELLIRSLGFGHITYLDYREHDHQITYTSQLSHVLAVSLLNSQDYTEETKNAIGDSFRDLTRIANMNINMWNTLFFENQENLTDAIQHLIVQLEFIQKQLETNKPDELKKALELAKERRLSF